MLSRPRIRTKYQLEDEDIETVLLLVLLRGEPVAPNRRITACRDPLDDKFLKVAVGGGADVLVSSDQDLLVLNPFEGIPIVTAAAFLAMLDQSGSGPAGPRGTYSTPPSTPRGTYSIPPLPGRG